MINVRSWRVCGAADGRGLMVYFDPYLEDVTIRQLTAPERADRVDSRVSVSGLRRDEITMIFDDGVLDEQFERSESTGGCS